MVDDCKMEAAFNQTRSINGNVLSLLVFLF